ncbi:MAG: cysteine--tRNA ligase [Planctomycetes bacterium]|nr:cysteine--tRNA ligase [Planctomycetota bacterium]
MTIQVHDSLSRQLRPLQPAEPGRVRMYLCGPTVYSDCHIGHLMGPVLFDAIARWLIARGLQVRFVINITDIDDKIIRRAQESGEDWRAVAERYTEQYFEFLAQLGVTTVTDHPRCTDHVPQMVEFIADLVAKDVAYVAADGVYFDIGRQPGYGKLSGRRVDEMLAGARIEAAVGLRHPADFALWKFAKPGEPSWPSPWGAGRPGWHIECSVMARELLGPRFELHGGGDDLKFPHHENEIAQSEAHGDGFADLWLHNGLAQSGGRKIAKSDPRMKDPEFARQFNARWLVDTFGAPAVRFFLLRGHYRRPIDFDPSNVEAARTGLVRLLERLGPMIEAPEDAAGAAVLDRALSSAELERHRERFCAAMDDDFNTGAAVAELFSIQAVAQGLTGAPRETALRLLRDLGRILGLFRPGDLAALRNAGGAAGDARVEGVVGLALELRQAARAAKDFATADALRDGLTNAGVAVHDGPAGATFELGPDPAGDRLDRLVAALTAIRNAARQRRDFATSDRIRDRLAELGVELRDGPA